MVSLALATEARSQTTRGELSIEDRHPIAAAIDILTERHSALISYEDAGYEHPDRNFEGVRGSPVDALLPGGGAFFVSYEISAETDEPADLSSTLQDLLGEYDAAIGEACFHIEREGEFWHVVPTQFRSSEGVWTRQASLLDVSITVRDRTLTGDASLIALAVAISDASGFPVVIGTMPRDLLRRHTGSLRTGSDNARMALENLLRSVDERLTWRIFYDPDALAYSIDIRMVSAAVP